jgi:type IV pilus assembly protein PilQ
MSPEEGLVSSLAVEKSEEGSRPLTRLVIATRQEVEHSVTADGSKLRIALAPVETKTQTTPAPAAAAQAPAGTTTGTTTGAPAGNGKGKMAFEPLGEEPASGAAQPAGGAGTPDKPMVAPAPRGAKATRLENIEVLAASGGAVIRIVGDGEFPYSTFALSEPHRFVIDLDGVINRSGRALQAVDGSVVERVRVAQFKPAPKPVSRVVFDLRGDSLPTIERTGDALVVSFPSASGAAAAMPAPAPAAPMVSQAKMAEPAPPAPAKTTTTKTTRKTTATTTTTTTAPAPAPAAQPSDLALAPHNPPTVPAGNRIETEEVSPMPASDPVPMKPVKAPKSSSVKVAPAAPGGSSSVAGTGKQVPIGKPVEVTPPATPLQGLAAQRGFGQTGKDKTYFGEPIDLKVSNADVTDVLRTFAQISGLNIIVQPGVQGTVTAELENVPWDQALEQVLKINNLDYELDGNVMRIAPTDTLKKEAEDRQKLVAAKALSIPLRTVYQRLSYGDARQVARLLKTGQSGILSQRGSVMVDLRTNALIIKELPSNMDAVLSLIDLLDAPEPQVMIEARIIETTKRFSRELGVNWGITAIADAAHGNTTGLVFPSNGSANGRVNLGGNAQNGVLSLKLGNVLNTFNLDVALRAAESEGLITILSAPKVATLNNQRAEIQSGLQIPIQTILNNTVTVQFINATLRLDVVPYVTAEGTVEMDIDISKREPQLAFLVPGATNAPIATKDARTRLVVRDGGTAVIGGIYKVTTDSGENRVPGLANIPLIGHLFKNRTRNEQNEELLIFITPRVIKI